MQVWVVSWNYIPIGGNGEWSKRVMAVCESTAVRDRVAVEIHRRMDADENTNGGYIDFDHVEMVVD